MNAETPAILKAVNVMFPITRRRIKTALILLVCICPGWNASSWAGQNNQKTPPTAMEEFTRIPPPPPTHWNDAFEDPLFVRPAVLGQIIQHPVDLHHSAATVCATADYAARPHSPLLAAQRLLELTSAKNQPEGQPDGEIDVTGSREPELTLLSALDLGLCHNPQVRGTWSEIRVQASALGQARAAYLPTLNGAVTRQRSTTTYTDSRDITAHNTSGYINMNWRLLDFGARNAAVESAGYQLAASIYSQNATLQQAIIDIVLAYYEAQTAGSAWQTRQHMTHLAQQILSSAQRRMQRGAGSQNDVYQATSSLARARLEEARSQGEYLKSMAALTYLLGLPVNTSFVLASTLEQDVSVIVDTQAQQQERVFIERALQDWLDQAKQHHPAIAAARAQWLAAEASITAVRAQGLPTLDFTANYYRNGRPTDAVTNLRSSERNIAITLNIPLFSGFDRTYQIRGAQAKAQYQRAQMEMTEQKVLMELVRAHADAQSSWNNLDAADTLYAAAQQAIESAQRQFEKGAADITQLIQAQSNLAEASLQRIETQAQWQSSRLALVVQGYAWELAEMP